MDKKAAAQATDRLHRADGQRRPSHISWNCPARIETSPQGGPKSTERYVVRSERYGKQNPQGEPARELRPGRPNLGKRPMPSPAYPKEPPRTTRNCAPEITSTAHVTTSRERVAGASRLLRVLGPTPLCRAWCHVRECRSSSRSEPSAVTRATFIPRDGDKATATEPNASTDAQSQPRLASPPWTPFPQS